MTAPARRWSWPFVGLVVIAFLASARTLGMGFLSDDWVIHDYLERHGLAGQWTGPWLGLSPELLHYYRPITMLAYAVDRAVFGLAPWGAHLHHLLWHIAGVALVYRICRQLGGPRVVAFVAGLLLACNPLVAGAVGWIAARCGVMAGTLTLMAISAHLAARARTPSPGPFDRWRVASLACGVLAVGAQENGYLALLTPLAIDLVLDGPRTVGRLVLRHVPAFAALAALALVRYAALGTLAGGYPEPQGLVAGGAASALAAKNAMIAGLRLAVPIPRWYFAEGVWLQGAAGALLLGVIALRGRTPKRTEGCDLSAVVRVGVLLIVTQFSLALIVDPALSPDTSHRWYVALGGAAMVIGGLATPLRRSWVGAATVALLVGSHIVGLARVQSTFIEADRDVQAVIASARERIDGVQDAGRPAFLSGLPRTRLGLSTYRWGVASAMGSPFYARPPRAVLYPIHEAANLGRAGWPGPPPIEWLVALAGERPLALALDADTRSATREAVVPDADALRAALAARFRDDFTVVAPTTGRATATRSPFAIPLAVRWACPLQDIEVFAFTPQGTVRLPVPHADRRAAIDLGPRLLDFARFSGTRATFYIVFVGSHPDDPRPALSPLIRYDVGPAGDGDPSGPDGGAR